MASKADKGDVQMKKQWARLLAAGLAAALAALLAGCGGEPARDPSRDFTTAESAAAPSRLGYRAMWISYLEWTGLDTASAETFTAGVSAMMDNCAAMGLDTVIVQVRPFGDAIYPSELFPWSHLVTGVQGQDPGYDPLAIFVQQAHARGLAIEAWINPYRLRLNDNVPAGELAQNGLAAAHPEWVKQAAGGLYLDPSNPQVREYICDGVEEVLRRYEVDGVQFDDYFYPVTGEEFDAAEYAASGTQLLLADWRRENVNALVRSVYETVRRVQDETGRSLVFGISPQGNNDNNYNGQYSDVGLWLSQPGYVDYVMPQVYWGYHYTLQSGSDRFAFENIVREWMEMPRAQEVRLYFGLGAYRVGASDGSSTPSDEWSSGHNLADMTDTLRAAGADGYALYRYDSLLRAGEYQALADAERAALAEKNAQDAQA